MTSVFTHCIEYERASLALNACRVESMNLTSRVQENEKLLAASSITRSSDELYGSSLKLVCLDGWCDSSCTVHKVTVLVTLIGMLPLLPCFYNKT